MSSPHKPEIGSAVAVGLVIGGIVASILSIPDLAYAAPVGAFIGGACTGYVLHDKIGRSAAAGALSGLLGLPFFLGLSQVFVIFGIITLPSVTQPSLSELQTAVVGIVIMDALAGAVGAFIVGAIHHPQKIQRESELTALQKEGQMKYCVQCGAQLTGSLVCSQCGAKQPGPV